MKNPRSRPRNHKAKKVACSVSAAALMLGVSDAASIGFNFQANYCSAASYTGAPVTANAFGIDANGWQNLIPMATGYGCDPGPFTTNEVINTTSTSDGLNPLPNGSINVTWTGYVANVSGFGGYDATAPHYTYGGNSYKPGAEEVYWGFIRDGVNFGPGSSGGDNNQSGWSVDITGLKSVFTNSSFVVEVIGAGDSISSLTNVFVIDATSSTTQSVSYPNIPPIGNVGDTAWPRGIGGGLSTGSGSVDADHLMIVGNRAQHSAGPPAFNNASQVAGFIITDKPVVTMPPQPALGGPGDVITLNPYAIGVPPLSYQWRLNGVSVPNATNLSYTIAGLAPASAGNYDLVVANSYGSTTSKVAAVTLDTLTLTTGNNFVADSNPSNPPRVGVDSGATWLASSSDGTKTRDGVMQFVATNSDKITVVGTPNFDSTTGTIMFWMRSAGNNPTGGFGAALFGRPLSKSGFDVVLVQQDNGTILFDAPLDANDFANQLVSVTSVSDNNWHLVALTYDQSDGGSASLYVDGNLEASSSNGAAWVSTAGKELELGFSSDSFWEAYDGLLDDVRFYSRQLTGTEIASVFTSGALVDTATLQMQFNFNNPPGPGFGLGWQENGVILQSAPAVQGPYTDVPASISPFKFIPGSGQIFYRYRGYTPKTFVTNPYMM